MGTIIAGWDGWRGTVYRLVVASTSRRRSVARALLDAALQLLRSKGTVRISAFVIQSDFHAVAFWNWMCERGFVPDPRPKVRYVLTVEGKGETSGGEHDG